ncbi:FAD-binding oxidoreductase [Nocardia suismassiliense]|uniref:FAD-binding oxidoreductase n=1 Tax=Nocardia suismassiliense TaxID=2077092 RepID=UPI000D1D6C05|nr:FAD-binding oxidoreductase [Nocardia suismassiliense]
MSDLDWIERFDAEVRPHLEGPVHRPGEEGYDAERAVFNVAADHRPALVVGVTGSADIAAVVRFAGTHGIPVAVLATGHTASVAADGGILINTGRMQELHIDREQRTARVEAGVRWECVINEASQYGLAPLNGSSPTVGVVGYTLGGGAGPLGRAFGFAADRVRELEVVTADGSIRRVTPDDEPELYWGLLGGKSNFGVVTSLEFELVEVSRLYGGGIFFPGAHAADVLHAYRQWVTDIPDEMSSSVGLLRIPPDPAMPEPLRGQFVVHLRVAYLGSAEEGARLLTPLRESAPPIFDMVMEMPYTQVHTIHQDPTDPLYLLDRGTFLRELDEAAVDAMVELAGPASDSPLLLVELRHLGGALARRLGPPNAVGNREWPFVLSGVGVGTPAGTEAIEENLELLLKRMAPWSPGRSFLNFLGHLDIGPDSVRGAYDEGDYERLVALKTTHDPKNIFRVNHNIPPA